MAVWRRCALALPAVFASLLAGCASRPPAGPSLSSFAYQTPGGGFQSALKRAANKVQGALAIEPKVVPADDPVRLSGQPVAMGAEVYRNAGRLCESRGHINAAIAQYQKGLQVAPNDVMTLISFARLRDRGGQFEEAISLYQRAIREDPNNAAALNDLGLCYARKGDCQNSLAAIGRAVQLQPDRALYRDNIATVLARLGRPEEALAHLSTVHPPAVAYYNTAYLLCRNGRGDLAISYLTRSLQHDPNLAPAQQMLARLGAPQPFQAEPPCFDTGRESIGARRAGEAGGNEPIRLLPPVAELGA